MKTQGGFELTYCSNIHAADGWPQVYDKLRQIPKSLKKRLGSNEPFGIGLRLSNQEATQLLEGRNLADLTGFLRDEGLYVALINGFPFAGFHDCCLKDQVFAPDWHTDERVEYTSRLIEILSALIPEGLDGGISTSPLSYKRWQITPSWDVLVANVIRVVQALIEVYDRTGRVLHLDIEPEPDGLIENTPEFLAFYELLLSQGAPLLKRARAEEAIRRHVAICYDVCHFAVEHEDPAETLASLRAAGVLIGRVQISSAVKVAIPNPAVEREALRLDLAPLADITYLHQVIGARERYADLTDALPHLNAAQSPEWRIHYHVPLFMESYGKLASTQSDVRSVLALLKPELVRHLEIETYTWSVLPPDLRLDIEDSIEREYRWVLNQL
jgi:hypothetical protein